MEHKISNERISSGIPTLDNMLGAKGYFRGSSILVSGTAGIGKSSVAAHFAQAACQRGERCCYFAMEESAAQIIRNKRSIGIDLEPLVNSGQLKIHAARPSVYGLEMHLATMQKLINDFKPQSVVLDPITNLITVGSIVEVRSMLTRLLDWLKVKQITSLYTSLTSAGSDMEQTDVGISSLMDTWLLLRDIELNGERNRGLYVLKSRGMSHSNQIREFLLTDQGVELIDVYLGTEGVLTGTSRQIQEEKDKALVLSRQHDIERRQRELERKRHSLENQINLLQAEFRAEEAELERIVSQEQDIDKVWRQGQKKIAHLRKSDHSLQTD
jgi:circadian clock protein KaiC